MPLNRHGDIIWNIANLLRGPYRPPQYRRVMIPLDRPAAAGLRAGRDKDEVIAFAQEAQG